MNFNTDKLLSNLNSSLQILTEYDIIYGFNFDLLFIQLHFPCECKCQDIYPFIYT